MLSADNLLRKLAEWHERMERQYNNADAAGDVMATVATARVGIAAIESFDKIRSNTTTVEADPATVQPPAFEPDTLPLALRTLIEAGVAAMPSPTDVAHQQEEPNRATA